MRRTITTILAAIAMIAVGVVGALAVGGTGTVDPPPKIAFLANGINPADAVAAGSIAGQLGAPVYTTRPDTLEPAARTGLVTYDPELIIVLGGPVAITDSVLAALSTATGLSIVPPTGTTPPGEGIVRAAGETRFDTAAEVAKLVSAYAPAYLPVTATALGAVDATRADQANNADQLDGKDSTDFALSNQACDQGEVVTGANAVGDLLCDADAINGGNADVLDGFDSTNFAAASQVVDRVFHTYNEVFPPLASNTSRAVLATPVTVPAGGNVLMIITVSGSFVNCASTCRVDTRVDGTETHAEAYQVSGPANQGSFSVSEVAGPFPAGDYTVDALYSASGSTFDPDSATLIVELVPTTQPARRLP